MATFDPPLSASEVAAGLGGEIRVTNTLGSGGQGATFRVEIEGEVAALKICPPNALLRSHARAKGEIEKLELVQSPHVVNLVDHGEAVFQSQTCMYLVLEFIDGKPMNELVGKLPDDELDAELRQLLGDVDSGIQALWARRVLHRDIKPANIMRRCDGDYIVVDLGMAKAPDDATLTATGGIVGTTGYFAPERIKGARVISHRADLFSLGVAAYEIAAGFNPFGAQPLRPWAIHPTPLHQIAPVSETLSNVIHQLLAPNRFDRPLSVSELL